jgi:succinyl-diaminopimelate desuccinylase
MVEYEYDLLCKLVAIDTNSTLRKNYDEITNLLLEEANTAGLTAEKIVDEKGIPHVLISPPNAPKKTKRVIFLTHYDVVAAGEGWDFDPFKPFIKNGKLFGRGAADDKSSIAATLAALKWAFEEKIPIKIDPVLVVAGGEETGEAESFLKKIEGDLCIVLDSNCEGLSIGASGIARLNVKVFGKQTHSAYPFMGKNSIYEASKIISFIQKVAKDMEENVLSRFCASTHYERVPRRISITRISSGVAANIVPAECDLLIDIRTIPEEKAEEAADKLKKMIEEYAKSNSIKIDIQIKSLMNGWYTTDENIINKFKEILEKILGSKVKVVADLGGTDGVFLIDRMPVIQFGTCRDENNIHGKNEFVYLEDIKKVKIFVEKVIALGL